MADPSVGRSVTPALGLVRRPRCMFCSRLFKLDQQLSRHLALVHDWLPDFECAEIGCDGSEAFTLKEDLYVHFERQHRHVDRVTPRGRQATPDAREVTTGERQVAPRDPEVMSEQQHVTPGESVVTPEERLIEPVNSELMPGGQEVTSGVPQVAPGDPEVTSRNLEVAPADLEVTLGELGVTSGDREVTSENWEDTPDDRQVMSADRAVTSGDRETLSLYLEDDSDDSPPPVKRFKDCHGDKATTAINTEEMIVDNLLEQPPNDEPGCSTVPVRDESSGMIQELNKDLTVFPQRASEPVDDYIDTFLGLVIHESNTTEAPHLEDVTLPTMNTNLLNKQKFRNSNDRASCSSGKRLVAARCMPAGDGTEDADSSFDQSVSSSNSSLLSTPDDAASEELVELVTKQEKPDEVSSDASLIVPPAKEPPIETAVTAVSDVCTSAGNASPEDLPPATVSVVPTSVDDELSHKPPTAASDVQLTATETPDKSQTASLLVVATSSANEACMPPALPPTDRPSATSSDSPPCTCQSNLCHTEPSTAAAFRCRLCSMKLDNETTLYLHVRIIHEINDIKRPVNVSKYLSRFTSSSQATESTSHSQRTNIEPPVNVLPTEKSVKTEQQSCETTEPLTAAPQQREIGDSTQKSKDLLAKEQTRKKSAGTTVRKRVPKRVYRCRLCCQLIDWTTKRDVHETQCSAAKNHAETPN